MDFPGDHGFHFRKALNLSQNIPNYKPVGDKLQGNPVLGTGFTFSLQLNITPLQRIFVVLEHAYG